MKVGVHALGTFDRLAHEGAEHAASLSQRTAVSPGVETTRINPTSATTAGRWRSIRDPVNSAPARPASNRIL